MLFEIRHAFQVESARRLPQLPDTHPCSRLHGHSFKLTFVFRGPLDSKKQWLLDYHDIKTRLGPIVTQLDHVYLNDVIGLEVPTSEVIAKWLYDHALTLIPETVQVCVQETPECECRYPAI